MPAAKDLVSQLLVADPARRIKVSDIMNHAWIQVLMRTRDISCHPYHDVQMDDERVPSTPLKTPSTLGSGSRPWAVGSDIFKAI